MKIEAQASNKSSLSYKSQVLAQLEFMLIDMQPINTAFKEQGESAVLTVAIGADWRNSIMGSLIMLKEA